MLRASQTATRALAPFARRGFPLKLAPFARHGLPLKLAPFARRGFSVWPTSAELKLHSGLLALPASSAARASDRERLSSAFGRIEERGRPLRGSGREVRPGHRRADVQDGPRALPPNLSPVRVAAAGRGRARAAPRRARRSRVGVG